MAETDFVFAVHNETNVISSIPRLHLELFDCYTELSDGKIAEIRAEEAKRILGTETAEPSPKWKKEQLAEFAEQRGIEVDPNATKAEILGAISAQEGVK